MAIEFTNKPNKWTNEGTAPSEDLKTNGFQAGYKPPAAVFNNQWHTTGECIEELQTKVSAENTARITHENSKSNPHSVTKTQVGLGNVDNTSDTNKPISTATQTALNNKVDKVNGKGLSTNDFTSAYKTKLDNLDTNLSAKANTSAVLTKTNTTAFTPTEDYQPATKKYVDDHSSTVKLADNLTTEDGTIALSAKQGKLLNDNKVDKSSVLLKDNTTEFTPTADYQPATKKYVDDNKTPIADNLTSTSTTSALSANQGKVLNDKVTALPIKSLAGQKVKPTYNTEVTAGEGAVIIGDLRKRTFYNTDKVNGGAIASGRYSVAAGCCSTARGDYSVALGQNCEALSSNSVAMGQSNITSGNQSIAMGYENTASGGCSIAMGQSNIASGGCSVAMGFYSVASGSCSIAMGKYNTALAYQTKIGKYGKDGTAGATNSTEGDAFIIGNGTSINDSARSNAFRVTYAGKAYGLSAYGSSGADYAEYFEWKDGNPDNEDRRGRLVTLDGEKIRFATAEDDYILGIISANPCVEGDIQPDDWQGKYLTDVFGQRLTQTVHIPARYEEREVVDPETGETKTESILIEKEHDAVQWIINPDYDQNKEYISREDRPEWAPVGMMGKLVVVDDGTCEVNGFCKAGINGIATKADNGYRVMKRIDETHILVLVR